MGHADRGLGEESLRQTRREEGEKRDEGTRGREREGDVRIHPSFPLPLRCPLLSSSSSPSFRFRRDGETRRRPAHAHPPRPPRSRSPLALSRRTTMASIRRQLRGRAREAVYNMPVWLIFITYLMQISSVLRFTIPPLTSQAQAHKRRTGQRDAKGRPSPGRLRSHLLLTQMSDNPGDKHTDIQT